MPDPYGNDHANPYQSPSQVSESSFAVPTDAVDRDTVKKFRQQIHALGAFWIIIGCALSTVVLDLLDLRPGIIDMPDGNVAVLAVFFCVGLAWIMLGVLACLKQLWAVYVGIVLTYLSLLVQARSLNLFPMVILFLVILQAHRVITWAKRLQSAGVPLTAKPDQLPATAEW